jgi:hypothetical protein
MDPAGTSGRQAHWIDDGAEEKVVFYCPDCAERQFEMGD